MEPTTTPETTLPITSNAPRVSQRKLRGLSDVIPAVIERQRGVHPALEALAGPTLAANEVFISRYDASRTQHPHAAREIEEFEAAVTPLRRATQAWMGPLVAAVPTITVSSFSNSSRSPKGIISDAKRMIELVQQHQASASEPLPFADALIADLTEKLEVAEKEFGDVGEIVSAQAELRNEARIAAGNLHRQLVGLRRSLRALIGRTHPDYRALLLRTRSPRVEEEAEENPNAEIDDDAENGDTETTNTESDAE
jgi:hypothetical protein